MNPLAIVLGAVILAVVIVDLLWTTLWVEGGAGPITSGLMSGGWRVIRRGGERYPQVRTLAGPSILLLGLTTWIALLWLGWTLVFVGGEEAVVDASGAGPVTWVDRAYFAGYALFTLGNGDFAPRGGAWQLATVLAAGTGLLLVTLIVTYVLSVLDAVTQKRAFASAVHGLGADGADVVRRGWEGEAFRGIDVPLDRLAGQLNTLTANHKAYPVMHYFHSRQAEQSPIVSVAVLDDALLCFRYGVAEADRPSDVALSSAQAAVRQYLDVLRGTFVERAERRPPHPSLDPLREAGVPTVDDDAFAGAVDDVDEPRRTLYGLVESDARRWPGADGR